jgi:NADPH:quinone reductase-like Zn-dependent oxidoreductase
MFGSKFRYVYVIMARITNNPQTECCQCIRQMSQASTVTLHDCLVRHGVDLSLFDPHSLPITPGTDLVGHIVKCHRPEELPEEYCIGDRVAAVVKSGGNSRFVQVPISNLLQVVPQTLDASDVAAIISHYTVAYQALRAVTAHVRPMLSLHGKNVLMFLYEGLLDGTSQALLQLCKKAKATVYVVAPSARHPYLRNVLEVLPLPSEDDDWSNRISSETVDIIFDATAEDVRPGHDEQLRRMQQAVFHGRSTVRIVQYGHAPLLRQPAIGNVCGAPLSLHWKLALSSWSSITVMENSYRRFQLDPVRFRQDVHTLLQWLHWNKLSPHISKRLGLGDIGKWHWALEAADPSIRGALVLLPWRQVSAVNSEH